MFGYLDELTIIFGVDRANGNGAVDCDRAEEDAERRDEHLGCDLDEDYVEHISTSVC